MSAYSDTLGAHPDWAAVMLFYCAVHCAERLLSYESIHSNSHGDREFEIKSRYASLWDNYRVLKAESEKARYMKGGLFSMNSAQVAKRLHDARLLPLIADIDARIKARTLIS